MWLIQLNDGDAPSYWSDSKMYNPLGHWTDREHAKRFDATEDAEAYIEKYLHSQQDLCKVVPK